MRKLKNSKSIWQYQCHSITGDVNDLQKQIIKFLTLNIKTIPSEKSFPLLIFFEILYC